MIFNLKQHFDCSTSNASLTAGKATRKAACVTLLTAAVVAAPLAIGCSREKPGAVASSKGVAAEFAAADTLVKQLPENVYGFLQFDVKSAAYKRLSNSPWGKTQYLTFDNLPAEQTKLVDLFARAGFNLKDGSWLENNIAEMIAYTGLTAENQGYVALSFRGTGALDKKLQNLQAELKKEAPTLREEKFAKGAGFAYPFEVPSSTGDKKTIEIFVAWDGDRGIITNQKAAAEKGLAGTNQLPAIINSPNFAKATSGYPGIDGRFAFGYLDAKKFVTEGLPKLTSATGDSAAQLATQLKSMPVSALSWSMAMSDAPYNNVRVVYEPADDKQKQLFTALKGSQSDKTIDYVAGNPLLFLSIDGGTLRQLKDLALTASSQPPSEEAKAALAAVDSVERIAISARVAAPGQSMLPIPDLSFVVQSKNPDGTLGQLQSLVGTAVSQSGLPGMNWTDKQIQGVAAKTMLSPMGMGIFMAKLDNMIVAASTEAQLTQIIGAQKGNGAQLAKSLTASMKDHLTAQPTVGSIYLNFNEVGALMENVGGLVSMYAPQSEEAKKLTSPEQIAEIRKLGVMVGSVSVGDEVIELKSAYQAAKPVA